MRAQMSSITVALANVTIYCVTVVREKRCLTQTQVSQLHTDSSCEPSTVELVTCD